MTISAQLDGQGMRRLQLVLALGAGVALSAGGYVAIADHAAPTSPDAPMTSATLPPLTAPIPGTVALEDMTWVEVRSAIKAGYTTVIVPTGGVEQNGPHMILGKHGYIVSAAARRIASALGHTLVAPTINYVPEGAYNPATGHMRFPGTIGVPDVVFAGILEGAARSLKAAGLRTIVFIGDHGANQPPQQAIADMLSKEWRSEGIRVAHIQAYYDDAAQTARLIVEGHSREEIGEHASLIDTSELLSVHPAGVEFERFPQPGVITEEHGARGDPRAATAQLGARLLDMRVTAAVAAIKALRATN